MREPMRRYASKHPKTDKERGYLNRRNKKAPARATPPQAANYLETGQETGAEQREVRNELREFERISIGIQRWMLRATIALALLTTAYVIITYRQLQTAKRSLEVTQRAYLGTTTPDIDFVNGGRIRLPIENFGHMPSPRIYQGTAQVLFKTSNGSTIRQSSQPFGGDRTAIPPGKGYFGVSIPLAVSAQEKNAIDHGEETIWVAGSIEYDTGFGERDKYSFCQIYNRDPAIQWNACPIVTFEDLQKLR
jgi:hypothetical protein